jgi:mannitol/fructose-specific phosphotransferase system IIA component (Ntr-type)
MIENFKLTEELITFVKKYDSWEEAIIESSRPLLDNGYVQQSYIDAMISSVKEYGPYIVIAPNIAMPHARPETGSIKVGFCVTVVEEPVAFSELPEHQARLLVSLSCVNAETHLKMLQALVEVLADEDKFNQILAATTKKQILDLFQ